MRYGAFLSMANYGASRLTTRNGSRLIHRRHHISDWINRKDVCQRCFSGIDDDHDGNCPTCANMDDDKAAWMKQMRLKLEIAGAQEKLDAKESI
jgi:hypothetical protein